MSPQTQLTQYRENFRHYAALARRHLFLSGQAERVLERRLPPTNEKVCHYYLKACGWLLMVQAQIEEMALPAPKQH